MKIRRTKDPESTTEPWSSHLGRTAGLTALAATAIIAILDYSTYIPTTRHLTSEYLASLAPLADILVVWLFLITLVALTNRVILPVGLVVVATVVLAVANRIKLNLRAEPIYPSDRDFIGEPSFLLTMVSPHVLVPAIVAVLAVAVGLIALSRRFERRHLPIWPRELPPKKRLLAVGARAGLVTLTTGLLVSAVSFNDPGNPWRNLYEVGSTGWKYWDQKENYASHGFVGGFLYNMPTSAMAMPAGYNEDTMAGISAKYQARAEAINKTRTGSLEDTNVVVVLSESFTDPTGLAGFTLDHDPIPKTRALMKQTPAGSMLAQRYGGGTANMEFEVLTGQSISMFAPQVASPYQMLVPQDSEYPSAVGWFAGQGFRPIAIHPFNTSMYKRGSVYKTFGFDDFINEKTMAQKDRIDASPFISDASAFHEVESQIATNDQPLFINLVTMQNHIPMDDVYDNPFGVNGLSADEANRVGNYARGLAYTDDALADFLDHLRRSDEKTVVVFYGDHLPGIYDSDVWEQNQDVQRYETPFFIWSNQGNTPRTLPVTSPIYFLPLLYETLDVPIPPYFALLDDLRAELSAHESGRTIAADGTETPLTEISPKAAGVLEDARMVQYDFSIGKRYGVETLWPGAVIGPDQH